MNSFVKYFSTLPILIAYWELSLYQRPKISSVKLPSGDAFDEFYLSSSNWRLEFGLECQKFSYNDFMPVRWWAKGFEFEGNFKIVAIF